MTPNELVSAMLFNVSQHFHASRTLRLSGGQGLVSAVEPRAGVVGSFRPTLGSGRPRGGRRPPGPLATQTAHGKDYTG